MKTLAPIGAEKSVTEIFIGEKEKQINKGTNNQYVTVFVTQYNVSLSSFVTTFRMLTQVVAEKSLQKNVHIVFNRSDRMKHLKFEKRKQNEEYHLYFHLHITLCLPKGVHKM